MNAVVVPVRSLSGAKNRLAMSLSDHDREALAVAMLADMLAELMRASSLDRVVVVSADPTLLERATELGAEALDEQRPAGLNAAVAAAALRLEGEGVRRLLAIPGDVPLLAAHEVDRAFASDPERWPVVLIPSASGTGTNGLLLSPPTVITPRFEGESYEAHGRACYEAGVEPLTIGLPSFELDVDTPADLAALMAAGGDRLSARVLARSKTAAA